MSHPPGVLLLRHAKAGHRSRWDGDDADRPLSRAGRKQAADLVKTLAGYEIERLVTSPYVRCAQTLEPLAEARGMTIEDSPDLAEGSPGDRVADVLLEAVGREAMVLCTHGDVLEATLAELRRRGVAMPKSATTKGGAWAFTQDDAGRLAATYLPSP